MDDAEGLTPGGPKRRRDPGFRSTRRPRSEPAAAGVPAAQPDAEATPAEEAAQSVAAEETPSVVEDDDPISALRHRLRARAEPEPIASPPTPSEMPVLETVERSRAAEDERRRQLWRDSATILIGVVLVLLLGQTFFPQVASGPAGSPTPLPSTVNIGSFGPPISLPPGATFGPIIDPSIGIDRTPTPIPVITMGPTPSPSPSPKPSPTKKPSPKPTVKPTVKPTTNPSSGSTAPPPTAEPTPAITEPPPPVASFTFEVTLLSVKFTSTSTGASGWAWEFGDPAAGTSSEENPTYVYLAPGDYEVKLTVTGPGGSNSATEVVTVTGT